MYKIYEANLPGDWTSNASNGSITVEKMNNASIPDFYSLKMNAKDATADMSFKKDIAAISGDSVFEYKVFFPQKVDGMAAELLSGSTGVLRLITENGKLCFVDSSGNSVPVYDYIANLWYSIKVKYNATTAKSDIYINSKLMKEGAELAASVASIDSVRYTISAANKSSCFRLTTV